MKKVKKSIEIVDAKIDFVSLVNKAANKQTFLFAKDENSAPRIKLEHKFIKADDGTHTVVGVVYEPGTADAHDNFMTIDEINKACEYFNDNGQGNDIQHNEVLAEGVEIVKSWVTTEDQELYGEIVKAGTWLMEVSVTNEAIWKAIEDGDITGFSMGGEGAFVQEDVEPFAKSESLNIVQKMLKAFGLTNYDVIEKGEVADRFNRSTLIDSFYNALWALDDTLYYWDSDDGWVFERDESKIREALQEFSTILESILTNQDSMTEFVTGQITASLEKSLNDRQSLIKNIEKGDNDDMKKSEVVDILKEETPNIVEAVVKAMKGEGQTQTTEPVEKSEEEVIQEAVSKALVSAGLKTEVVEKSFEEKIAEEIKKQMGDANGGSNQVDTETTTTTGAVEKSEPGYITAIRNA